jgi:hypothetical protein
MGRKGLRVWGAYASSRVVFGGSPNKVFRRDAGNCKRGRVRSQPLFSKCAGLRRLAEGSPNLSLTEGLDSQEAINKTSRHA